MILIIRNDPIASFDLEKDDLFIGNKFWEIIKVFNLDFRPNMDRYDGPFSFLLGEMLLDEDDGNYIRKTRRSVIASQGLSKQEESALGLVLSNDVVDMIKILINRSIIGADIYQLYT